MTVGILEVHGAAGYPIMEYRSYDFYAFLRENRCSPVQSGIFHSKCKMLFRPFATIFLQNNHSGRIPCAQEEPVSPFIAQTKLKTQNLAIEGFGSFQISDSYCYLIHTGNRDHEHTSFGPLP